MDEPFSAPDKRKEELSTKQRALIALEDMRDRLAAMERSRNEPIAVIGCSCRFPGGATSVESYWRLLQEGRDGIGEVPADRWNLEEFYDPELSRPGTMNTRWGGFLEDLDQFDPGFFGIPVREASTLDPQQRLLLEVSWEALERAGYAPDRLAGSMAGVFVGISSWDYANLLTEAPPRGGTGFALSIAANRLSYCFDFQGPSVALDTACSSSLVTVELACQSLRGGLSDLALAGGVNVILSPWTTVAFSQAGMMASDGRCKTFDAAANGYVRSEGCGIVVLKRLSDALRDRDHILGVIRGSAVNHDGRSNGLTSPNGQAQKALIRRALKNAGVKPHQIGYVEAHGTGTPLGDAVEVDSLWEVIREGRSGHATCVLGSVKTNVGHLEAAAGVAGLIKTLLLLENGEIPPHLHLKTISPSLALQDKPGLTIVTRPTPWTRGAQPRIAGVSSFGFGGTNAHVIVAEAPAPETRPKLMERPAHMLTISAKTPSALRALVRRYHSYLGGTSENIADICYTASAGRSHFEHRVSVTAASVEELREKLAASGSTGASPFAARAVPGAGQPRIAMLFGPSHDVLVRQTLFETQPTFRRLLQDCIDVTGPLSGGDTDDRALFAFQYALTRTLQSWGIQPAAVFGVGAGALAAACVAGVIDWKDAILLAGNPEAVRRIVFRSPSLPLVSAETGRTIEPGSTPGMDYWQGYRRRTSPVAIALDSLRARGCHVFLESSRGQVAPVELRGESDLWLACAEDRRPAWETLLDTVGALYVNGTSVDWKGFDEGYERSRVVLPTYPFERRRCWLDPSEMRRFEGPLKNSVAGAVRVGLHAPGRPRDPADAPEVLEIAVEQLGLVGTGRRDAVQGLLRAGALGRRDPEQRRGHALEERDQTAEGARLGQMLQPRQPVLVRQRLEAIPALAHLVHEPFPWSGRWMRQVEDAAGGLGTAREVHDRFADVVHRREVHDAAAEVRRVAQFDASLCEPGNQVVQLAVARTTVAADEPGAIDRRRQAAGARRQHQLLGHPLGLGVSHGQAAPITQVLVLGQPIRRLESWREQHGDGADIVERFRPSCGAEPQDFRRATDDRALQRLIGQDEVDRGRRVVDHVDGVGHQRVCGIVETEARFGQVARHHGDPRRQLFIPFADLTLAREQALAGSRRRLAANQAVHRGGGVTDQRSQQVCAEIARGPREQHVSRVRCKG